MSGCRLHLAVALLCLLFVQTAGFSRGDKDSKCDHGFWAIPSGHGTFYVSHKPMTTVDCHKFQVLLEVEVKGKTGSDLSSVLSNTSISSLKPSKGFPLKDVQSNKSIGVSLFSGNFEGSGKDLGVSGFFRLTRKLYFEELQFGSGGGHIGLLFGSPEQVLLANRIDASFPNDEIATIEAVDPAQAPLLDGMVTSNALKVKITSPEKSILSKPLAIQAVTSGTPGPSVMVKVKKKWVQAFPPDFVGAHRRSVD